MAWIEFSKTREAHQQDARKIKLVDHLDYTETNYMFNPKVRAQIHYLYAHMPEQKPDETWYQKVISLLQSRNTPI